MKLPSASQVGIGVFVASVLASLGVLGLDLNLYLTGDMTITEWAIEKPYRPVAIVMLTLVGPAGLWVHFRTYRKR